MKLLILAAIILVRINAIAQTNVVKKETTPVFNNQKEQEDYWAKEMFEKNYTKQSFKKYSSKIEIIDSNTFKYGNNILTVKSASEEVKEIFRSGIIYSTIIGGGESRPNITCITKEQKAIYDFIRIDTLTISNIEELKALNKPPKVKRFRFLLWRKGIANPSLYFFELTNDRANEKMSQMTFIRDSQLTFFKMCSILI